MLKSKHLKHFIALIFHTALVILFFLTTPVEAQNLSSNYAMKTVVIDAGHGGYDNGASGYTGKREKDITLATALKLGKYIEENIPNIKVIYTRKTDVFVELYERAAIANRAKADFFISIHCNSSTNHDACGSESWVLGLHKSEANLEVAKRENSVIDLEDQASQHYEFDPNSEMGHIIMSMAQSAYLDNSIDFASKVQDQFAKRVQRRSRGIKQAGFMVLYKTAMPAVLIELGFISNQEEEQFLSSTAGQELMASAIMRSLRDYKNQIESKASGGNVSPPPQKEEVVEIRSVITKTDTEKQIESEVTTNAVTSDSAKAYSPEQIIFRVQFYAAPGRADKNSKFTRDFADIQYEDNGKGVLRYMTKDFLSYQEVKDAQIAIAAKGYKDAFIVAYQNNRRIPIPKDLY